MSSPLYAVTVLEIRGNVARFDVVSVCEAGCFTVSRLFATSLLHEPFWNTIYARPGVPWPRRIDGALQSSFAEDELIEWSGGGVPGSEETRLDFVRDVAWGSFRNSPPLRAQPDGDGLYRIGYRHGGPGFAPAASSYSEALAQSYLGGSTSKLPAATLHVEVAHPRWIEHLAPGMLWDSYAFDDEGGIVL